MSRILLTFAFLLVLPIPALADQEIPPDLKAGADFVWQLTQIKRTEDVIQHFRSPKIMAIVKANVDLDNDSKMRFNEIFKSVRALEERSPLVPVVAIIDQKPIALDIGNQYVTYRIETKRGDVLFFEVHLMGVDELTIEGVKELSSKEVTDRLRGRKMFKVEQQKQ